MSSLNQTWGAASAEWSSSCKSELGKYSRVPAADRSEALPSFHKVVLCYEPSISALGRSGSGHSGAHCNIEGGREGAPHPTCTGVGRQRHPLPLSGRRFPTNLLSCDSVLQPLEGAASPAALRSLPAARRWRPRMPGGLAVQGRRGCGAFALRLFEGCVVAQASQFPRSVSQGYECAGDPRGAGSAGPGG